MSIIERIFRPWILKEKTSAVSPGLTFEQDEQSSSYPPEDVFRDNQPPGNSEMTTKSEESKLRLFLNRNFQQLGENDGYTFHSIELLETGKRQISTEFLLIIDETIQELLQRKLNLLNLEAEVEAISSVTQRQIHNTINHLAETIEQLKLQKELSIDFEGWITHAMHSYHNGFERGMLEYIQFNRIFEVKPIL